MATGRVGNITSLGVSVEAAFGYDPDDTSPVWTDISTYVLGFSTRRGRKREIDRVTAGHCLIRLENPDRRFEGGYTGGPYGSNVVPMTPIRITCTRNAVTYPVFYGFADEWAPSFEPRFPKTAFVDLRATDAFKVLALIPLVQTVWEQEVLSDSPVVWWRLGEEKFSDIAIDRTGNGRHGSYIGAPRQTQGLVLYDEDGARTFDGLNDGITRFNSDVTVTGAMTLECWLRYIDDGFSFGNTIAAQFATGTSSDQWILDVQTYIAGEPEIVTYIFYHTVAGAAGPLANIEVQSAKHHLVATYSSGTANIYINGVLVKTDSSAFFAPGPAAFNGLTVGKADPRDNDSRWLSGDLDEVALYNQALSSTQITDHYTAAIAPRDGELTGTRIGWLLDQAAWPAALRDIDAGQSVLGPVNVDGRSTIDLLWETVDFEDGNLFVARDGDITFYQRTARYTDTTATVSQATYSYTGANSKTSGVTFDYSDELLINHAIVTTRAGHIFESEDSTSIGRYLRRTKRLQTPSSDPNYADALAQWTVQIGKDPQRRITSLKIPTSRDTTTFDATVGLELGYRVTVTLDPPGTGTISEALLVEGIDHDVTPNSWTTTLWCSPEPSPDIAIVGVSLVGGSEVVGY